MPEGRQPALLLHVTEWCGGGGVVVVDARGEAACFIAGCY